MDYPQVCTLAIATAFQIFVGCLLGNFAKLAVSIYSPTSNLECYLVNFIWSILQHDKIYESVLYLNWYEFPIKQQHLYRFFVLKCQHPSMLTIGGYAPLDLGSCVQVRNIL